MVLWLPQKRYTEKVEAEIVYVTTSCTMLPWHQTLLTRICISCTSTQKDSFYVDMV